MKKAILFICLFMAFSSYAQNVGIGTTNPGERLDVNGNINVTGTIKTNGTDGTAGQILMKNSSGSLVWGDMSEFKNQAVFITSTSGNWTIPAGVTRVWVEAWGGGGGGNWYGGGGGGAYVSAILTVVPGTTITYQVGSAGSGGTSSSTPGGNSIFGYSSATFTAHGGRNPEFTALSALLIPGAGGLYTLNLAARATSFRAIEGQPGKPLIPISYQYNATTYIESCTGGDGGDAANAANTGAKGGMFVHNTTTNNPIRLIFPTTGQLPGGGGGSGYNSIVAAVSIGNASGTSGSNGMLIIHY